MRRLLSLLKGLLLGILAIAPRPALASGPTRAVVVVYDGWGDPTGFSITGRVLEDQGERAATPNGKERENLVDNLKALESDEVRGARVRVTVGGASYSATTDDDGNFTVIVQGLRGEMQLPPGRAQAVVEVTGPSSVAAKPASGVVHVLSKEASFLAVVSDIDDTVVKTHVTDKRKLVATVLLKNAAQLEPVQGAAENYAEAARAGASAFFYLSGSPQNFYSRLRAFLDKNEFPSGPLLLKNLGDDALLKQQGYKGARIDELLARFPRMRVILVGDSGEHDPEIYREAKKKHGDRVAAIVIRTTGGANNDAARFDGCVVVDDAYAHDQVLAGLARTALAAGNADAAGGAR